MYQCLRSCSATSVVGVYRHAGVPIETRAAIAGLHRTTVGSTPIVYEYAVACPWVDEVHRTRRSVPLPLGGVSRWVQHPHCVQARCGVPHSIPDVFHRSG